MTSAQTLSGDGWMAGFTAVCLLLAGTAAAGWLVAVARARAWTPVWAWFRSLSRVHKLMVLALVAGATYYGGSKTGGGNGGGGGDNGDGEGRQRAPRRIRTPEWTDDGTGPTNLFAVTGFTVCPTNQTVSFTVEWNAAYLAAMDSRCADIFFTTNLLSRGWMKIAWRWLPEETNRYSFTLDPWNVDGHFQETFTNSFSTTGFYTLGLDFDSDGDRLTDAFERFVLGTSPYRADTDGDGLNDYDEYWSGTDPCNPDSDGDGLLDGEEVYQYYSDPFSDDSDGDGLPDWMEASGCYSERTPRWIADAVVTNVLTTGGADVDRAVWHVTLPSSVSLAGGVYSNLTIDVNGVVYLSATNITTASRDTSLPMWDEGWNPADIAVAALWTDLVAKTNLGSRVSFNVTETGDAVVEFLNMGFSDANYPTNTCSFQIVFSPAATNRVMVFWRGIDTDVFYDLDSFPVAGVRLDANGRSEYWWTQFFDGDSSAVWRFGFGTDPRRADTDYDGLSDSEEVLIYGTDPFVWDSDDDGLPDYDEVVTYGTNPLSVDTDGDGMSDVWEVKSGLNPLLDDSGDDPDGDGLTNLAEWQTGTDPLKADTDRDGISDGVELSLGLNPCSHDTDGDGLPDGWEIANNLDPLSDAGTDGAAGDPDNDGLNNADEYRNNTDPRNPDTDGDGVSDGVEVGNGSNPCDGNDNGVPPPVTDFLELPFNIYGDFAAWEMTIQGLGPDDTRLFKLNTDLPGDSRTVRQRLRKGNSYRLSMRWLRSRPDYDYNWYCWQAQIDGQPSDRTYYSYDPARRAGVADIVLGNGWIAENRDGLLTSHVDMHDDQPDNPGGGNVAEGLIATLHVPKAEVAFVEADDDTWETELPQEKVMLSDKPARIRIRISPGITTMEQAKEVMGATVTVKTTGTAPQGVAVPIGDGDTGTLRNGCFEIRMERTFAQLREAGLLSARDDDGVTEMAWWDNGLEHPAATSNLTDSQAFAQLNAEFRGKSTRYGTLNSQPPNSPQHISFFQAAGSEIITATYGGTESSRRQIQNQADYFYYSGHGNHDDAEIAPNITPSMVENKWNKDLDCVIFSACSVFDIGDYNNNFGNQNSPGLLWARSGAHFLLGYNYLAPSDVGGATTRIINYWRAHHTADGEIGAWMDANAQNRAWNACAIENTGNGVRYTYFRKLFWRHKKIEVQIGVQQ